MGQDSFNDGDTGLIKARFLQPPAPPVMPPPSGLRVGPVMDAAQAGPPIGAAKSGFFGGHDYASSLGGYFTDLPIPLNTVTSTPAGWWEVGDEALLPKALRYRFDRKMLEKTQDQANRQAGAAGDHPIDWHIAEPGAFSFFKDAMRMRRPPIALQQTLPR